METTHSKDDPPDSPSSDSHTQRTFTDTKENAPNTTVNIDDDEVVSAAPWRALFAFTTRANIPLLLFAITASVIAGLASPATNLFNGYLFEGFSDFANGTVNKDELMQRQTRYVIYLTAVAAGSWIFHSLQFIAWLAFGELQAKSARDRLFRGLLEKEIEWYDRRKNGIGALLPRLAAQIRELQLATAQPLGFLFSLAATAIASLAQALVLSWDLTLVTLSTVPFFMVIVAYCGVPMQRNLIQQQKQFTEAQKYATSALTSIETVKCFNGQEIEVDKYRTSINAAAIWYGWVANASAIQLGFVAFLTFSMFVQGFYYGAILVAKGKIDSGDVITAFFSAVGAFQAIAAILQQIIVFEKGKVAGVSLRAIIAQIENSSVARHSEDRIVPAQCRGNIDIENLSFAYPSRPDRMAIKDVTMYIEASEMTFLIGKSGSGKSTIGQLLMRFYTASGNGQIKIDNHNLESLDTGWLRSNITLVEQTSLLFDDTVFNNIAFGQQDSSNVTRAEVTKALEFALLQLTVNDLPEGLDTMVGSRIAGMSGGQRQRMALARARLRDTPILILDESTSALDHVSRSLMMEAIRIWRKDKTTVVITHDVSQVMANDYVYLLGDGCILQEGYQKHLSKTKNTPFQAYLSEEKREQISSDVTDGFEPVEPDASSSVYSRESFRQSLGSYDWVDPIEITLAAGEQVPNRTSFLPTALKEGSPLLGLRGYGIDGFASLAQTPGADPPPTPKLVASPVDQTFLLDSWSESESESTVTSERTSQTLQERVDETGRQAAKARRKTSDSASRYRKTGNGMTISSICDDMSPNALGSDKNSLAQLNSIKYIFGTIWPNLDTFGRTLLLVGFWGATVHAIATPVFSYILAQLLGTYNIPGGDKRKALQLSMAILGISVAEATHTWIYRFCHEYVSELWVDRLRTEAYTRILDQSRDFFEKEENGISQLTESLDRNAEEMRNLLGRFASLSYVAMVMVAVALVWAMIAQWKMTLIAICVAPYIYGVTKAFARVSEKWERHSNDAAEVANAIFTQTFINIKSVRALTLEAHFTKKFTQATNDALKIGFQRSFYSGFFYGLSDSAGNFSTAMNFYVGSKLIAGGASITDIIQVFTMLIFTIGNVGIILEYIPQIGSSKDTAARLLRLVTLPGDSHEHRGDTRITAIGEIVFEDLTFNYPSRPAQTILKNINLQLLPGTTTAIVGGSGSGKSTIANLLLDLYSTTATPPKATQSGSLTFGGRDMQHIHTPSLRALIIPVSQTPTLFAATVSENIAYGLPAHSLLRKLENISLAAQQAGIHDFILSLPQGYATPIGDGGIGVSGGQAQRLAIARALVRKPAVLILDEATSALDPASAKLVRQTVQDLVRASRLADSSSSSPGRRPMTVLIITHDRKMMEMAERVVVLDQGRVVEEGSFRELIRRRYGKLVNLLSGGEWDAAEEDVKDAGVRNGQRVGGKLPMFNDVEWEMKMKKKQKKSRPRTTSELVQGDS